MSNIVKEYETDAYEVLLEDKEGYLFMHCEVFEEKLSTYKKLKHLISDILDWADSEDYDGVHTITPNHKMAELIPGAFLIDDIHQDGCKYGVYKWALK